MGNPFHPVWGGVVQQAYRAFNIDVIETTAWLGIVPVLLAMWAARKGRDSARPVMQWLLIGAVFFVWALGPHLMAFGHNTGMMLPQTLLRYVPLVNNARIPGRAIVIVYLALAVLSAIASAEWRARSHGGRVDVAAIALAVLVDYLPAPFPLSAVNSPVLYDTLRNRTEEGAVCELRLGIRDALESVAPWMSAAYDKDPLLSGLLDLSARAGTEGRSPLPDRALASTRLRENGIRFIVLNRMSASPALVEYVERVLPVTLIEEADGRSLYLVRDTFGP